MDNLNDTDDIDSLLSGYNKSLNEEPINIGVTEDKKIEIGLAEDKPTEIKDPNTWQGDLNYFQSGPKAGQLKKRSKHHATPKETMTLSGSLITGAMFIMLVDLLFPLLITVLNNSFTKDKIEVEDLQLTEKQKKDLSPVADEVVKYLSMQANPVWLMAIAMTGIYGINYMAAKQSAKRKPYER